VVPLAVTASQELAWRLADLTGVVWRPVIPLPWWLLAWCHWGIAVGGSGRMRLGHQGPSRLAEG
jgi:hypothetical protein